jgi:1-aminocyclopropane-1-carboxylate deaminase/D-cysteine desulfhydrase-like pyridoxal-dependent ACC family enzyme
LEHTYVEFDLLYDPMMWRCLLEHKQYLDNKSLIYIHQGGILGNESMLPRYQRQWD